VSLIVSAVGLFHHEGFHLQSLPHQRFQFAHRMLKQAQAPTGKKCFAGINEAGPFLCSRIIHRKPRQRGHHMPAVLPALPVRGQVSIDDGHRLPSLYQAHGEMIETINRLILAQANSLATCGGPDFYVLENPNPHAKTLSTKSGGRFRRKLNTTAWLIISEGKRWRW